MPRRVVMLSTKKLLVALATAWSVFAQQPDPAHATEHNQGMRRRLGHPPLFFREDWKQVPDTPVEHPLTQAAVANPNLELKLYGAGKDIVENGIPGDEFNFLHVWTGLCQAPCALAFRDKNNYVDLSGLGKISWLIKVSGFHQVRPIVKLANGTWLVGDFGVGNILEYNPFQINLSELRWLKLDINKVVTKDDWIEHPDLSKVDEVGFTDLMPGSGHGDGGYSDVGWIEVYGKPIGRNGAHATPTKR
jgi:hypothetical protein